MKCENCGNEYPSQYWFHGERETRPLICVQCEIPAGLERADSRAERQLLPEGRRPEVGGSIQLLPQIAKYVRERELVGFLIALAIILAIILLLMLPGILFSLHSGPI
jgi:hypothetical protein